MPPVSRSSRDMQQLANIRCSCIPPLAQTARRSILQAKVCSFAFACTSQATANTLHLHTKQPALVICRSERGRTRSEHSHTQLQPLHSNFESTVGPRGILLIGFNKPEQTTVKAWFHQMEPGFPVCSCTQAQLSMSLQEAVTGDIGSFRVMNSEQPLQEKVPRLALLSGLTAEETLGLVEYWEHTGIATPIFASTVSTALDKPLREVILEIAESYAGSKAGDRKELDSAGLRAAIRQKMEEKKLAIGPRSGPIVLDRSTIRSPQQEESRRVRKSSESKQADAKTHSTRGKGFGI